MYTEYWQLETKPFEPSFDERFVFYTNTQQAAVHKLRYGIESARGASLLAGPSGCGKSLLVDVLQSQLNEQVGNFVRLAFPLMSTRDLLAYLAEEIGAPAADPAERTIEESLRRLEFALQERGRRNQQTVLVFEEGHLLEDGGLLETVRLLTNLQSTTQSGLTLLLVGQTALVSALRRHPALDQRLDMKILLGTLSEQETSDYVIHRLNAAGATRSVFAADALAALYRLSRGVPREINRLCDLALVVGFAAQQHTIDAPQIESVHRELVTISAVAA